MPGERCCACWPAIPSHDRCHHCPQQRRFPPGGAAAAPAFPGGPDPGRNHGGEPVRARRRVPGAAARRFGGDRRASCPQARWSSTPARTTGWRTRRPGRSSTAPRMPGPGRTGCPSFRASGTSSAAPSGSRSPAATRHSSLLALTPGFSGRPADARRRRHRRRLRNLGRGQGRQGQPDRLRGDGLHEPVRRGRRPPAHPRDRAGALQRRRRTRHRFLHAHAGTDEPGHPGHGHRQGRPAAAQERAAKPNCASTGSTPTRTSRSSTCCRRASGPPPSRCRGPTMLPCSWPSMRTPAA